MPIHLPNINRRVALFTLATVVLVVGGVWGALHLLVDVDAFRQKFIASVKEASGYNVQVASAELSIFPLPAVVLGDVTIENPPEASDNYFFSALSVEFRLSLPALLQGETRPGHVVVTEPDVNLERFSAEKNNWQPFLTLLGSQDGEPLKAADISIMNGYVYYTNNSVNQTEEIKELTGVLQLDGSGGIALDAEFTAFDRRGTVTVATSDGRIDAYNDFDITLAADVRFDEDRLAYDGRATLDADAPLKLKGTLQVNVKDSRFWMERLMEDAAKTGAFKTVDDSLPLTMRAEFDTPDEGSRVNIPEFVYGLTNGRAGLAWKHDGEVMQARGTFDFKMLNFDQTIHGKNEERNLNALFSLLLPAGVRGDFNIRAEKLVAHGVEFSNAQVTTGLIEQEMTLNKAVAYLPGDSRILAFGIIKRDSGGQVNFDGSTELMGKDAVGFIEGIGLSKINVLPQVRDKFRARANLFLAPDRGTISEMRFESGDFYFTGGINLNPGRKYDVETTLRFRKASLEPLMNYFTPVVDQEDAHALEALNRRLPWLSELPGDYFINLLFEDFNVGSKKGVRSQFVVSLSKDVINMETVDVTFEDAKIKGSVLFDQKEPTPTIEALLGFSTFNLNTLIANDLVDHPVKRGNQEMVWSTDNFNFNYLRGYHGRMSLHVDEAVHDAFKIEDLDVTAQSRDGVWDVKAITGKLWDGSLSANGKLDVTSVPALFGTFYLTNTLVEGLLRDTAGFTGLRGRVSLSGDVATSGINPLDWVRNMTGMLAFRGTDVLIPGFDLANLVQAVPSVRSVADVVNTARLATLRGFSSFSLVEGGLEISQGALSTLGEKGLTFRSRHALGNFQGRIDLLHWMLNASIAFQLISIVASDYPSVTVTLQDSMDDPVIDLDTRSLESWVARQKLLQ